MIGLYLEAPAIAAPGLDGWSSSRPVLSGEQSYRAAPLPDYMPDILPATARRRGSASTRLAVQVAQESLIASTWPARDLTGVFASSIGDPYITDQMCRAVAAPEPVVSPICFHNSVHNAPAGYWSIATGSLQPTSSLAAFDGTFAAGLLSAAAQCRGEGRPVLLVAYDLPYPEPLLHARPLLGPFAVALILTPERTGSSLLRCTLRLCEEGPATRMASPGLEALRTGNPAARALPVLALMAAPAPADIALDYLPQAGLTLECHPC